MPQLLYFPAFSRADSIKLKISQDEPLSVEKLLGFILYNSNNRHTLQEFIMKNCLRKSEDTIFPFSICNTIAFNEVLNKKISYLKKGLNKEYWEDHFSYSNASVTHAMNPFNSFEWFYRDISDKLKVLERFLE